MVSEDQLAEAGLKDENGNRLRHHVQHVLLKLELLLKHVFRVLFAI